MDKIIFVYNADSGILNGIKDLLHKNLSPATYDCQLCTVTYDNFGMIREWREFIKSLKIEAIFLHRDELEKDYQINNISLPAVFKFDKMSGINLWISNTELNQCQSLSELKKLVFSKL